MTAHAVCLRAGLTREDAEDIASQFVVLYLSRIYCRGETKAKRNPQRLLPLFLRCALSRYRSRAQRQVTLADADEGSFLEATSAARYAQTERLAAQRALWEATLQTVDRLPPLQRDVLLGFVLHDESLASIAARRGISEDAAKQALYRARRAVGAAMSDWREDN